MIRVVLTFLAVSGLLSALAWLLRDPFLLWLVDATTLQTSTILNALGFTNTIYENQIMLPERILIIALECSALYIMIVYIALVIAYPFRREIKASFLPIGLAIIYASNLMRLVGVGVVSRYVSPVIFDIIHDFLFQALMVFVVLVLWIIMLAVQRNGPNKRTVLFVLCVTATSVILGLLFLWLADMAPRVFPTSSTSFLVPAFALILSAFGVNWKRKMLWIFGTTMLFFSTGFLLIKSGLLFTASSSSYAIGLSLYAVISLGIPIGSIILFIGRNPQRLWGKELFRKEFEAI